jgi:hypothetical protein
MLPALPRLPDVQGLIDREQYFVLHAPRQSGKTTAMMAEVDKINEDGSHYAIFCSLGVLSKITDRAEAMSALDGILLEAFNTSHIKALEAAASRDFWTTGAERQNFIAAPLQVRLRELSKTLDKDLVIFFDEVDGLAGGPLLSLLSQLREGFIARAKTPFPRSIALIGMRNIRDYKIKIRPDPESLGSSSPFNIISEALTLADFTVGEIKDLYGQHAEAVGQIFTEEAVHRAWYWSEGQPWLVNALARQVVEKILKFDFQPAITADLIDQAAGILMRRRDTHIDSLLAILHESRVQRIIEPMLAFSDESALTVKSAEDRASLNDNLQYCLDLGLVKQDGRLRPANPIYASVISRYLNENIKDELPEELIGRWMDNQTIHMSALLKEFQIYWAEKADMYLKGFLYTEAGPHMLLSAILQRVVNGGAMVIEEYANGSGFADIVVKYAGRKYPIELKIKDNQRSMAASQKQLLGYMDPLLQREGWLLIFDRKPDKSWLKKIRWKTETMKDGAVIHVAGC